MASPCLWVPVAIYRQADTLLAKKSAGGSNLREAVELILKNDSGVQAEKPSPSSGLVDAGALLQKGLAALTNNPHDALGVPLGAQTVDVKKAFRKMALKYHPDKNPKTTPLFQAISLAQEKLSDIGIRREEENKARAASSTAQPKPGSGAEAQAARERERAAAAGRPQPSQPQPSSFARAQAEFHEQRQAREQAASQKPSTQQQRQEGPGSRPAAASVPKNASEYARAAHQRNQQQKAEPFSYPRPSSTPDEEEVERDAAAFRKRREEAQRAAEAKSQSHQSQRDAKLRAEEKEREAAEVAAEAARRHREEVLREGQRAYAEEVRRRRAAEEEAQKKREKETESARTAAAQAADARAQAYNNATNPTPTPDQRSKDAQARAAAEADRVLRGYRGTNSRSSASQAAFSAGVAAASGHAGAGTIPVNVGKTFTANQQGETSAQASAGKHIPYTGAAAYMRQQRRGLIPSRPFGLQTVAVGSTQIELKWTVKPLPGDTQMPKCEFQWRLVSLTAGASGVPVGHAMGNWQTANKLLEVQTVRKKNLISGALYEFRVRALSDSSVTEAGMSVSGECSEWSDSLKVRLKADTFQPQSKPAAAADTASAVRSDHKTTVNHNTSSGSGAKAGPGSGQRAAGGPMSYVPHSDNYEEDIYANSDYSYNSNAAAAAGPSIGSNKTGADSKPLGAGSVPVSAAPQGKRKDLRQMEHEFVVSDEEMEEVEDRLKPMAASPKHMHRTPSRVWGDPNSEGAEGAGASANSKSSIFDRTHYHKIYNHNASFGVGNAQEVSSEDGSSSGDEAFEVPDALGGIGARNSGTAKRGKLARRPLDDETADSKSGASTQPSFAAEDEMLFDLWAPPSDGPSGSSSPRAKYEHPVHELPDKASKVIGTLVPGICVQALSPKNARAGGGLGLTGGNWIFCKFHRTAALKPVESGSGKRYEGAKANGNVGTTSTRNTAASTSSASSGASGGEWGWALLRDGNHTFLAPTAYDEEEENSRVGTENYDYDEAQWDADDQEEGDVPSSFGGTGATSGVGAETGEPYQYEQDDCEVWVEHADEYGNTYYVHEQTGESRWEPPEWVQELDPATGIHYYVHHVPIPAEVSNGTSASSTSNPGSPLQRGTYGGAGISLHSTWSRPEHFAQIRRTQNEADFTGDEREHENGDTAAAYDAKQAEYTTAGNADADEDVDEPTYDYQEWEDEDD